MCIRDRCEAPTVVRTLLKGAFLEWLAQPDGTPYVGMIVTSTVIGFKTEDRGKYIEVTTRNSIYTFERV